MSFARFNSILAARNKANFPIKQDISLPSTVSVSSKFLIEVQQHVLGFTV